MTTNDEIGTVVSRTTRGGTVSIEANAEPSRTDTASVDTDDTLDRVLKKADAAERKRTAEQMDALRRHLTAPITAGRFSELAVGGHGPTSAIEKFFSNGEAE